MMGHDGVVVATGALSEAFSAVELKLGRKEGELVDSGELGASQSRDR